MNYLSSDKVKKYILLNFCLVKLFCLFDLLNFQNPIVCQRETNGTFLYFRKTECYSQEVLLHSFICLPLPYVEGIVLICNFDLHCVTTTFNVLHVTCSNVEHLLMQQKEHKSSPSLQTLVFKANIYDLIQKFNH